VVANDSSPVADEPPEDAIELEYQLTLRKGRTSLRENTERGTDEDHRPDRQPPPLLNPIHQDGPGPTGEVEDQGQCREQDRAEVDRPVIGLISMVRKLAYKRSRTRSEGCP
jgi:hypothetical protein